MLLLLLKITQDQTGTGLLIIGITEEVYLKQLRRGRTVRKQIEGP